MNYLQVNRSQQVEINDVLSESLKVRLGVPQGSILGPLLFIIFINDFSKSTQSFQFINYADDTTLLSNLEQFGNVNDPVHLANSINIERCNVYKWLLKNKVKLNVSKTKYMRFKF